MSDETPPITSAPAESTAGPPTKSFREFLEGVPPGAAFNISNKDFRVQIVPRVPEHEFVLTVPQLSLHCPTDACERIMFFDSRQKTLTITEGINDEFLSYTCRNCAKTHKTFSIRFMVGLSPREIAAWKFGEFPQFGPPMPARLLQLAGENVDILKKGRRSENQGLGIGAFAYYRRVVELQKSKLIDELKKAVTRLGGDSTTLASLEKARSETQFTNAIELIARVIPKDLFVQGQNPLTLLHRPLSIGLHGRGDAECLKDAHNIRVVLTALLEKIAWISDEQAELDAAVKELLTSANKQPDQNEQLK